MREFMKLVESQTPQTLYHQAPANMRGRIAELGLQHPYDIPGDLGVAMSNDETAGIYFTDNAEDIDARFDMWAVDVRGLGLHPDETTDWPEGHTWWVTYDEVGPERLSIVHAAAGRTNLTESFGNVIDFNPNGGDETLFRLDLKAHNGTITDQEIKAFGSFLNSHKMDFIRMYHGTSARHDVIGSGLLATSSGRARSIQSAPGYVYLAYDPQSALSFARMAYAGDYNADLVVYAVDVTVKRLLPDHDQLRNKRQYGGMDVGTTLAHSLIYGRGARVKGRIEPHQIHIWGRFNRQGEKITEAFDGTSDWPATITSAELLKLVKGWHHTPQDFVDGRITKHLKAYPTYELRRVPIDHLDLEAFTVDDDKIADYAKLTTAAPPIVVGQWGMILDGNHRANAAAQRGETDILAYVGIEQRFG